MKQWLGRWTLNGVAIFGFLYLFAPIAVIVLFSFNKPRGRFNLVWQKFTFDNWLDPFAKSDLTDAFVQSLKIAAVATVVATILGTMIALALSRYKFMGSPIVNLLLILPLTTPEIVMGASLLNLFIDFPILGNIQRGFWTILIAHIMFCVSFVSLTIKARVRGIDWSLEDAGQDLGAAPARVFWKVTFPMILPGILAAALLSFALSIDDYIITLFNRGSVQTFPVYVAGAFQREIAPQVNVLATLVLIVSVGLLLAGTAFSRRREGVTPEL